MPSPIDGSMMQTENSDMSMKERTKGRKLEEKIDDETSCISELPNTTIVSVLHDKPAGKNLEKKVFKSWSAIKNLGQNVVSEVVAVLLSSTWSSISSISQVQTGCFPGDFCMNGDSAMKRISWKNPQSEKGDISPRSSDDIFKSKIEFKKNIYETSEKSSKEIAMSTDDVYEEAIDNDEGRCSNKFLEKSGVTASVRESDNIHDESQIILEPKPRGSRLLENQEHFFHKTKKLFYFCYSSNTALQNHWSANGNDFSPGIALHETNQDSSNKKVKKPWTAHNNVPIPKNGLHEANQNPSKTEKQRIAHNSVSMSEISAVAADGEKATFQVTEEHENFETMKPRFEYVDDVLPLFEYTFDGMLLTCYLQNFESKVNKKNICKSEEEMVTLHTDLAKQETAMLFQSYKSDESNKVSTEKFLDSDCCAVWKLIDRMCNDWQYSYDGMSSQTETTKSESHIFSLGDFDAFFPTMEQKLERKYNDLWLYSTFYQNLKLFDEDILLSLQNIFMALISCLEVVFTKHYVADFIKHFEAVFTKHSEAFSRLFAALGWDNPKQANYWKSQGGNFSSERISHLVRFTTKTRKEPNGVGLQAVSHIGMNIKKTPKGKQVLKKGNTRLNLIESSFSAAFLLVESSENRQRIQKGNMLREKMWQTLLNQSFNSIRVGIHNGMVKISLKLPHPKAWNEQEFLSESQRESYGEKPVTGGNGSTNFHVTEEENAMNRKNKLLEGNNEIEKSDSKSTSVNGFMADLLHEVSKNYEEAEFGEEFFVEEPEMIKLMQPPQNEAAREATFGGFGNEWYSPEEFSRGGFYHRDCDDTVTCFSCHIQHDIDEVIGSPPSDARWHYADCRHALSFRSIPPHGQVSAALHSINGGFEEQVTSHPRQVSSDGAVSDNAGDPPGQRSIYIPPGDWRMESYRLSTFERFPITDPNIRKNFAKNGFFFTGFSDQVKCFVCARSVSRWSNGDNPADHKWHKPSCPFIRGQPCDNIPIKSIFGNLAARYAPSETVGFRGGGGHFSQDLPERVGQAGAGVLISQTNGNLRQPELVRRPEIPTGIRDPPPRSTPQVPTTRNAVVNTPQPRAPAPTWRMANVASSDHKRFLTNLYLNRELDRLTSFARWPTDRPNVPPTALAKTGFYYLGDMDRVQCFSCGGVLRNWSLDDSAEREHRVHFGGCNMVLGNEPLNIPIPSSPESPELLAVNYPLRFPSNPHMRGQAQREATFDRRWQTGRINVSIEQIAEAGFFYLGERDRVKCWYCNGGLQNWEFDDIPWDEHAKWFPNCQFLLRMKGQRFVHHHLGPHAQLARPIIGRQDGSPLENIRFPGSSRGYDIPPAARRPPTPPLTIIDPQEETRKRKERVKTIMRDSETAKTVVGMGFSEQVVETVIEDRILSTNDTTSNGVYGSVSELLDDVIKKEEEIRQEEEQRRNEMNSMVSNPSVYSIASSAISSLGPSPGSGKYNVSYYGEDDDMNDIDMYGSMNGDEETHMKEVAGSSSQSLQQQLNVIEEERMCKICYDNVANMLFTPCSHMVCCMECTQAIRNCPICRKRIEKAIKTYLK